MKERFWEIDFFRGIAIVLMLLFNWSYSLAWLGIYRVAEGDIYWWLFPRLIASMFIIIAGIVLSIGYSKNKDAMKYVKRGFIILSLGLLITLATWIYAPQEFIIFGILHLIGVSIMISPVFLKLSNEKLLTLSAVFVLTGFSLQFAYFDFPWLVWLGFMPNNFTSLDYFPLLPWLGVFFMGITLGNTFYSDGTRQFRPWEKKTYSSLFIFLGQRSLLIYLVHQPLLLALLYVLGLL